jgi:hypothetical protein
MSPIPTVLQWAVTAIAAHGLTLLTSWLRIRWQAQQEHAHHQDLVSVAHALPDGGQIRVHRSDGTWTRLAVTRASSAEDCHE